MRGQPGAAALLQAAVDPLVAIATLATALAAFGGSFDGGWLILSLLVFAMTFPGSLARGSSPGALEQALEIAASWFAVVGLLLLLGWASHTLSAFDERALLAWALGTPAALFGAHRALPLWLPRILAAEGMHKTAVIAGANDLGRRLAARLRGDPMLGFAFAGYFDDRGASRLRDLPASENLGTLERLADYARSHRVDVIYIALPMASQPRILRLLEELRDTTASIYFVPDIFVSDLIQARVDFVGELSVVAVCETPFYGFNGMVKRASDLVLATGILLLISPLMLAIAAGVKLSSPGPVLFKQRRYGVDGRKIVVYKFRSMTVAEDGDVVRQATRNDSRVTRFGAFLRRSSLDELPNLWNVVRGEMSIVGPRPTVQVQVDQYTERQRGRLHVKPGITGWAQVNGRASLPWSERIELDLWYVEHCSLVLDLRILARTVRILIRGDGLYKGETGGWGK